MGSGISKKLRSKKSAKAKKATAAANQEEKSPGLPESSPAASAIHDQTVQPTSQLQGQQSAGNPPAAAELPPQPSWDQSLPQQAPGLTQQSSGLVQQTSGLSQQPSGLPQQTSTSALSTQLSQLSSGTGSSTPKFGQIAKKMDKKAKRQQRDQIEQARRAGIVQMHLERKQAEKKHLTAVLSAASREPSPAPSRQSSREPGAAVTAGDSTPRHMSPLRQQRVAAALKAAKDPRLSPRFQSPQRSPRAASQLAAPLARYSSPEPQHAVSGLVVSPARLSTPPPSRQSSNRLTATGFAPPAQIQNQGPVSANRYSTSPQPQARPARSPARDLSPPLNASAARWSSPEPQRQVTSDLATSAGRLSLKELHLPFSRRDLSYGVNPVYSPDVVKRADYSPRLPPSVSGDYSAVPVSPRRGHSPLTAVNNPAYSPEPADRQLCTPQRVHEQPPHARFPSPEMSSRRLNSSVEEPAQPYTAGRVFAPAGQHQQPGRVFSPPPPVRQYEEQRPIARELALRTDARGYSPQQPEYDESQQTLARGYDSDSAGPAEYGTRAAARGAQSTQRLLRRDSREKSEGRGYAAPDKPSEKELTADVPPTNERLLRNVSIGVAEQKPENGTQQHRADAHSSQRLLRRDSREVPEQQAAGALQPVQYEEQSGQSNPHSAHRLLRNNSHEAAAYTIQAHREADREQEEQQPAVRQSSQRLLRRGSSNSVEEPQQGVLPTASRNSPPTERGRGSGEEEKAEVDGPPEYSTRLLNNGRMAVAGRQSRPKARGYGSEDGGREAASPHSPRGRSLEPVERKHSHDSVPSRDWSPDPRSYQNQNLGSGGSTFHSPPRSPFADEDADGIAEVHSTVFSASRPYSPDRTNGHLSTGVTPNGKIAGAPNGSTVAKGSTTNDSTNRVQANGRLLSPYRGPMGAARDPSMQANGVNGNSILGFRPETPEVLDGTVGSEYPPATHSASFIRPSPFSAPSRQITGEGVDKYKELGVMGKSCTGETKLMKNVQTLALVAAKWVEHASGEALSKETEREIVNHRRLRHPNIIGFHEVFTTMDHLVIVMEHASGGQLDAWIESNGRFLESKARYIFLQIVDAVAFCHKRGVVHRNLRADNILLAGSVYEPVAKISGFGYSKDIAMDSIAVSTVAQPAYQPPEMLTAVRNELERGQNAAALDCWAIGVILFYMLAGHMPFWDGDNPGELNPRLMRNITTAKYSFPEDVELSLECRDFVSCLLVVDPAKRMSADDMKSHPWLAGRLLPDIDAAEESSQTVFDIQAVIERARQRRKDGPRPRTLNQ